MQAQSSLSYQGKTRRLVGVQARACELSTQEAEEDQGYIGELFSSPSLALPPIIVLASLSNCYVGKTGGLLAYVYDYHIEYY